MVNPCARANDRKEANKGMKEGFSEFSSLHRLITSKFLKKFSMHLIVKPGRCVLL